MSEASPKSRFNVLNHWSHTMRMGGSLAGAARSLQRQLWIAPLVTAVVLAVIGWILYRMVESSLQARLGDELHTILDADVSALDLWLSVRRDNAMDLAGREAVVKNIETLAGEAEANASDAELLAAPQQSELKKLLDPARKTKNFNGYIVVDRQGRILASFRDELIGKDAKELYADHEFVERALAGEAVVSRPVPSAALLSDSRGGLRAGVPTMFACAPVLNETGKPLAALCLRMPPQGEFTTILNVARFGTSGETYAFDRQGLMLSSSRFDSELKRIGLLPDNDDADSVLTLRLRDPLANVAAGQPAPRVDKPLTYVVAEATAGRDGVDVTGHRDYRGVPVVGTWRWLPKHGFGVATTVDYADAYQALSYVRFTFWIIFGLLVLTAIGMLVAMLWVSRMRFALKLAAVESKKLGQYTLEEKLGEGGMGVVYKARHAFLRRPTAVKLLHPSLSSDEAVGRFQREVQLTSQLTHPNTIAIYDYGRTDDGVFYYAMEFLDGIPLDALVTQYGPQPEGRVISILEQVCGSLAEAHSSGLIHRDIKPANLLLNRRGRQFDVVKVLDFGLVKAIDAGSDATVTLARSILGTPHFMSPEAILSPNDIDARSDLYAVGVVGYFLLTGQHPFSGASVMDICNQHLNRAPDRPSQRMVTPLSPDLEAVIMRLMEKKRENRPASAEEVAELLAKCTSAESWARAAAEKWWSECFAGPADRTVGAKTPDTSRDAETVVLGSKPA